MNIKKAKQEFKDMLEGEGYFEIVEIDGVGFCALQRFVFTVGLMVGLDYAGYKYRYCFHSLAEAKEALKKWNGKDHPSGNWIKRKGGGGDIPNPNYNQNQ